MEMEVNNTECIIIGANHHNTLGVIRSLGNKRIISFAIIISDKRKPYVSYSRYIKHNRILVSINELIPFLVDSAKIFKSKPVIISCADYVTAELYAHRDMLFSSYILPIWYGKVCDIMNKNTMSNIAIKCGLNTPNIVNINGMKFDRGGGLFS